MILAACLLFAAGPLDEIDAARKALASIPPQDRAATLFVSFLGSPVEERADLECAFNLALNSTTFRRKPIRLIPVVGKSETLYRLDVEEIAWPDDAYKKLIADEPYFYPLAVDVYMIRADWFIREATFGKTYYGLLGFGKTRKDVEKKIGLDRKTAENLRARHGARVVESGVALNPRAVKRLGSTLGAFWETDDVLENNKGGNPFERIDQLDFDKVADAHEFFGPLPNGLYWWALANKQGDLVDAAPTNIALDRRAFIAAGDLKDASKERPSYRIGEVQNAHSCMGCHAMGLRAAPDFVAGAVQGGRLKVQAYDKNTKRNVEDFFDSRSQNSAMATDSLQLQQSVERVTSRPPLESANVFAVERWKYAEKMVTIEQASRELNVDAKAFAEAAKAPDALRLAIAYWFYGKNDARSAQIVLGLDDERYKAFAAGQLVPFGGDTLKALVGGSAVPRARWEDSAYLEASLLICYQQSPRKDVTAAMVRDMIKPPEKPVEKPAEIKTEGTGAPPPAKIDYGKQETAIPPRRRDVDKTTGRPIEFNDRTGQWQFLEAQQ